MIDHSPEISGSTGRIALSNSTTEYVVRFRLPLLQALRREGYDVVVVSPEDAYVDDLYAAGFSHYPVRLKGASTGPITELMALRDLYRAYRHIKPDLVLHFTPKVDIYGGLVARRLGIPFINNLSGMGTAITRGGWLGALVNRLLQLSQGKAEHLFVQNPDDLDHVLGRKIAVRDQVSVLPGSGVDLAVFPFKPLPVETSDSGAVHFVLIARLVTEKGVKEFMESAAIVRKAYPRARFSIVGSIPPGQGGRIGASDIEAWALEPGQSWLGKKASVQSIIEEADCVVLPSYYREGTPRILLEAASMGRPLIAADSIGTREPVVQYHNGLLCAPRDADSLAEAMQTMIELGSQRRAEMGRAGRRLMEKYYDVRFVVGAYMDKIRNTLR
mgnify:FL=1